VRELCALLGAGKSNGSTGGHFEQKTICKKKVKKKGMAAGRFFKKFISASQFRPNTGNRRDSEGGGNKARLQYVPGWNDGVYRNRSTDSCT